MISNLMPFLDGIDHVSVTDVLYGDEAPSPDALWKSCFPPIEAWL